MGSASILDKLCRICTAEQIDGILIFGEEGKRLFLETKIKKYLHVAISVEDKLPKMVCGNCSKKLDSIHRFATMAVEMQDKLKVLATTSCTVETDSTPETKEEEQPIDVQTKKEEITLQTWNYPEKEPPNYQEADVTEVEVKIDPMSLLCLMEDDDDKDPKDDNSIKKSDDEKEEEKEDENDDVENQRSDKINKELASFYDFVCKDCGTKFETYTELDSHSRHEHNKRGIVECHCGKVLSLRSRLVTHRQHHTGAFPFKCDICGKGFSLRFLLKKHKANHVADESKPYRCTVCPRGYNSEIGLQNHLWAHFPRGRRLLVNNDVYQQRLGVQNTLFTHKPLNHGSNRAFMCTVCGKLLSTKGNLKVHLETHRATGKYGCEICGRIFKTQSNLYRHKEYHKGKQFPCPVCGRVYPTKSTLRAHSITHSDLRPHACPYCVKTFKRNQDLKFHLNQHTGERPYKCPYCPKAFASSGNCFSHRKRMHAKEVERDRAAQLR